MRPVLCDFVICTLWECTIGDFVNTIDDQRARALQIHAKWHVLVVRERQEFFVHRQQQRDNATKITKISESLQKFHAARDTYCSRRSARLASAFIGYNTSVDSKKN